MTFHYLIICDKCGAKEEVPILPGFFGVQSYQIIPDGYDKDARRQLHICRACLQKEETARYNALRASCGLEPVDETAPPPNLQQRPLDNVLPTSSL